MSEAARYVAEFHGHSNSSGDDHARELCPTLLREEAVEAIVELRFSKVDRRALARELGDVVFVAYYAAHVYGIDLDAALCEVHRAAIDKMDANVRRPSDGKIIKPPGFAPPDMTAAVERVG